LYSSHVPGASYAFNDTSITYHKRSPICTFDPITPKELTHVVSQQATNGSMGKRNSSPLAERQVKKSHYLS